MKITPEREQDERRSKLAMQIPSLVTLRSRVRAQMEDASDEVVNAVATICQAAYEDWQEYVNTDPWPKGKRPAQPPPDAEQIRRRGSYILLARDYLDWQL